MLSSNSASIINEFRDGTNEGAWTADILMRLMNSVAADFTGTMRIEMDERLLSAAVQPASQPGKNLDLPAVVTVTNEYAFMKPTDGGISGDPAMRIIGPNELIPNRDGDVTIWTPYGTIICKDIIVDGTTITPPEDGSGCSQTGTYLFGMVDGVKTCFEVEPC
jgi:hypothetical protein